MKQLERYEKKNYCTLDSECDAGLCCFDQKCMPSSQCFYWIYFPLIVAAGCGILFAYIASGCLYLYLRYQDNRIKNEVKAPWNKKKAANDKALRVQRNREKKEKLRQEKEAREEQERREQEYHQEMMEAYKRQREEEERVLREQQEEQERFVREQQEEEQRLQWEDEERKRQEALDEIDRQVKQIEEMRLKEEIEKRHKMEDLDLFLGVPENHPVK